MAFYAFWTQFFPPGPQFTGDDVPNLKDKVFIVTGSNTGVGYELARIIYSKQAKVYMATRSEAKALTAINKIKAIQTSTPGELRYLHLDLSDLSSIKSTVEAFSAQESELHGLINNAGIGLVPPETMSPQGHSVYMATMCLGPHLLTQLLVPQLRRAAATSPEASVRVLWASSRLLDQDAPKGGLALSECSSPSDNMGRLYASAKAGNFFLGSMLAKQLKEDGIISLTVNPGLLKTQMYDPLPKLLRLAISSLLLYEPVFGAYTYLWASFSEEVKQEDSGRYVINWGRWHPKMREDILESLKSKSEGGTGLAKEFWEWCEDETKKWR